MVIWIFQILISPPWQPVNAIKVFFLLKKSHEYPGLPEMTVYLLESGQIEME